MGCDGIQPFPLPTTRKSLDLIISELRYQGALSEVQARRMPEEDLRKYAENFPVILHKHKDYHYVDYYPLNDLYPDIRAKLTCPKERRAIAELNHVEVELWHPHFIGSQYLGTGSFSLCIKGSTPDSVQRTIVGLENIKNSFYPFVVGKPAYPFRFSRLV